MRWFWCLPIIVFLGCTNVWQKAVSSSAVIAIGADRGVSAAYTVEADRVLAEVEAENGTFRDYCNRMQPIWEDFRKAECAIEALGTVAITGQDVLDADGSLGIEWASAACGAISAVVDVWSLLGDPPESASLAMSAVCALSGNRWSEPSACGAVGVVPGCEE